MSSNISLDSTDSDVFYVEQISNEPSPRRNNSPDILNSTEQSEHHAARMPPNPRLHPLSPIFLQLTTTLTSQRYQWFWAAAPDCSPKSERLESAAQSF